MACKVPLDGLVCIFKEKPQYTTLWLFAWRINFYCIIFTFCFLLSSNSECVLGKTWGIHKTKWLCGTFTSWKWQRQIKSLFPVTQLVRVFKLKQVATPKIGSAKFLVWGELSLASSSARVQETFYNFVTRIPVSRMQLHDDRRTHKALLEKFNYKIFHPQNQCRDCLWWYLLNEISLWCCPPTVATMLCIVSYTKNSIFTVKTGTEATWK